MAFSAMTPRLVQSAALGSQVSQSFLPREATLFSSFFNAEANHLHGSPSFSVGVSPRSVSGLRSVKVFATAEKASKPTTITFFVHERRATPDVSLLSVAAPDNKLGLNNLQFGSLLLYDNIIRVSAAADAEELGRETGLVGLTGDNKSFYMSHVFSLATPKYSGSLSLQGRFDPTTTSELIITGGTGAFRFARGYAISNTVFAAPDQSLVIFKYDVVLKYCD